jgi:hypothetical protein
MPEATPMASNIPITTKLTLGRYNISLVIIPARYLRKSKEKYTATYL